MTTLQYKLNLDARWKMNIKLNTIASVLFDLGAKSGLLWPFWNSQNMFPQPEWNVSYILYSLSSEHTHGWLER